MTLIYFVVVEPGQPALKLIVNNFGSDVLQPTGQLDRAKLAGIIFGSESKRRMLNKCTHPYIRRAMMFEALKHFLKGGVNRVAELHGYNMPVMLIYSYFYRQVCSSSCFAFTLRVRSIY